MSRCAPTCVRKAAPRTCWTSAVRCRRSETEGILAKLRASPEVAWAEPNDREPLQQSTTPSDPFFPGTVGQWWLQPAGGTDAHSIEMRQRGVPGLQRAWTWNSGSASVPVAVLDTGVTAHPELQGRWLPGVDMVSDAAMANDGDGRDSDPADPGDWVSAPERAQDAFSTCESQDSSWHGTIVGGMLAARTDNQEGVAAVSWDARVVPVRVAGKCGAEVADIVDGMRWAAGLWVRDGQRGWLPRNPNPVRVINLSFGGHKPCSRAYQSTIDELREIGVVVVAAAGNGQGMVTRPGQLPRRGRRGGVESRWLQGALLQLRPRGDAGHRRRRQRRTVARRRRPAQPVQRRHQPSRVKRSMRAASAPALRRRSLPVPRP